MGRVGDHTALRQVFKQRCVETVKYMRPLCSAGSFIEREIEGQYWGTYKEHPQLHALKEQ